MALSISESQAVMTLLRWMGAPDFHNDRPTDERALHALELLRDKAFKALSAGVTEQELRDTFKRFTAQREPAPQPPLVGRLAVDALAVAWCDDDDGGDIVTISNTALSPHQPLIELTPMDAIDIGAQLVVCGREALEQKWG